MRSIARPRLLAASALLLIPAGALTAAAPSTAAGGEPTSNSDECTSIPVSNVTQFDDGGYDYEFIVDGTPVHSPQPPKSFNPGTASDAQLERYGFPPRPADASDSRGEWASLVAHYKYTPTVPEMCLTNSYATLSTDTSDVWGGYEGEPASGNRYVAISGEFDQPKKLADSCASSTAAEWVGLGGVKARSDGTWGLLQTGTMRGNSGDPWAFYEWVSKTGGIGQAKLQNVVIHVGDHIHASLFYQTSNHQANFVVQNETTGQTDTKIANFNADTYYDGRDADFIVERTSHDTGTSTVPYALQDFGAVNWTAAKAENQTGEWLYLAGLHDQIKLTMTYYGHASDLPLATTGAIGGTSGGAFTTTYKNCG